MGIGTDTHTCTHVYTQSHCGSPALLTDTHCDIDAYLFGLGGLPGLGHIALNFLTIHTGASKKM